MCFQVFHASIQTFTFVTWTLHRALEKSKTPALDACVNAKDILAIAEEYWQLALVLRVKFHALITDKSLNLKRYCLGRT